MLDLHDCDGLDDRAPSSAASLLRVLLHNLAVGLRHEHLKSASVRAVAGDVTAWLVKVRGQGRKPHVDQVYAQFAATLVARGPDLFFERDKPVTSFADRLAVSYQPSWAFQFWLNDSVPTAGKDDHTFADAKFLAETFRTRGHRRTDATVGMPPNPLWLTPLVGLVDDVVERAKMGERFSRGGVEGPDLLRRLLGLQKRASPEQAVVVISKRRIEDLVAAETAPAEAGCESEGKRRFAAPTQFDAQDYPRFRHWPVHAHQPDPDFGRTWALDAAELAEVADHGAPEVVAAPMSLEDVNRIVALGEISDEPLTIDEREAADRAFADAVCAGQSLATLCQRLEEQLKHAR